METNLLAQLRTSKGMENNQSFLKHFKKMTGEELPYSTLYQYEHGQTRPSERRLGLMKIALELTRSEERALRASFNEEEAPFKNVSLHKRHEVRNRSGKKRKPYVRTAPKKGPIPRKEKKEPTTRMRRRSSEVRRYEELIAHLAPVLGKETMRKNETKKHIFGLALLSKH